MSEQAGLSAPMRDESHSMDIITIHESWQDQSHESQEDYCECSSRTQSISIRSIWQPDTPDETPIPVASIAKACTCPA